MSILRSMVRLDAVLVTALLGALAPCGTALQAQRPTADTAAVVDTAGPRPERKPPISPRRAFTYSLLVPGYAQSVLGRNRAGSIIVAFETAAIVMIRQSAADIREARHNLADSVIVSYVDATGAPSIRYERTPFGSSLVRSRRSHLEDWIAVMLANHLFAAADAYVAALLWDLPAEIAFRAAPRTAGFALRVRW